MSLQKAFELYPEVYAEIFRLGVAFEKTVGITKDFIKENANKMSAAEFQKKHPKIFNQILLRGSYAMRCKMLYDSAALNEPIPSYLVPTEQAEPSPVRPRQHCYLPL
jgi:hypothetical protein